MNLKIEKPMIRMVDNRKLEVNRQWFDEWFHTYVAPVNAMLGEAVLVYAYGNNNVWDRTEYEDCNVKTHKAYLIGIEPIEKETAEDVLRDVIKQFQAANVDGSDILERAKRVLGEWGCE